MDVGGTRHHIHQTKTFLTTDTQKVKEYKTTPGTWQTWWNIHKAFANKCDGRTFTQVLSQTKARKQLPRTHKVTPQLPQKHAGLKYHKTTSYREQLGKHTIKHQHVQRSNTHIDGPVANQEKPYQGQISLQNRYSVLQQETSFEEVQEQKVKLKHKRHTNISHKNPQKFYFPKCQNIPQEASNHAVIGFQGHADQEGQIHHSIMDHNDCHINPDVTVAPVQSDKIPDDILHNKHLCQDYNNCIQQTGLEVGFVPFTPLTVYQGSPKILQACPDIIEAHKLIKKSGMPNFMSCRIPVQGHLKSEKCQYYLQDYWDKQIVDLITYGFPLDFDRNINLQSVQENHKSALDFPQEIDKYIEMEIKHGALLGPFQELPIHSHISPLMTRAKQISDKRRTIIDLSWPRGHAVNTGVHKNKYLGTYFKLQYPSIDNITMALNNLGPGAMLYKVDISRAFRHIRKDPRDIDLLGISHNNLYLDQSLPFGFRHGSIFSQRCSDAIRHIMRQYGFPGLWNYIDDLIYTGLPSTIHQSYQFLLSLLEELGLDISIEKLVAPATSVVCLGINIDTISRTISIPDQKLQEITNLCKNWSQKLYCTKNQLQSLLGSLLYITKCVKPARSFLNRMLTVLRDNYEKTKIKLTQSFFKDLN